MRFLLVIRCYYYLVFVSFQIYQTFFNNICFSRLQQGRQAFKSKTMELCLYQIQMKDKKHNNSDFRRQLDDSFQIFEENQSPNLVKEESIFQQNLQAYQTDQTLKTRKKLTIQSQGKLSTTIKKSHKPSPNHNFQKHAVVTTKKLMNLPSKSEKNEVERVAHIMWNIFKGSNLKTKKTINIIFGQAEISKPIYRQMLQSCGFEQILAYDEKTIQSAQDFLRLRFVQCVSELDLRQSLRTSRHIRMSEEFIVYFMEMIEQLKRGPLVKRRINETTAKRIEAKIESNREQFDQFAVIRQN